MRTHDEDAALAEKLKAHHAVMIRDLGRLSENLAKAPASGADAAQAKRALVDWVRDVLVPHAEEEEATTYRAAGELPEGRLLIRSMLAEHVLIRRTAEHMSAAKDPVEAATFGRALFDIFDSHQRKENDIILPLLVGSDTVSLTEVMGRVHAHEHGHSH
jgi:hypothetical protein